MKLSLQGIYVIIIFCLCNCTNPSVENKHQNDKSQTLEPPNIVFILVDDMRWDEFGEGGHNYIKTPNIDRLALEGANFQNAFATTPLCSPSRASFLTGEYAHANGITDNLARNEQSHKLETFPKRLHKEGYETAFIGKWHMGNDDSARPGFDHWVALKGQGESNDPFLNINGSRGIQKGYVTDVLTKYSLEFIQKKRSKPFLLYLSHKGLHPNIMQNDDGSVDDINSGGFIAAPRHKGMYRNETFKRRPNSGVPPIDKPSLARKIQGLPPLGPETITPEKVIRERAEMLMAIDEGLGEIISQLKKNNQLENTIVALAGDHGYFYGEHGLDVERRLAFEETLRIPFLIRYPRQIDPGSKPEEMILNIDLAPTLLDLAGIVPGTNIHGKSLVPVLNKSDKNWRSSFLIEYNSDTVWPRLVTMGYRAVRTDRYKYIHYLDLQGMDELYDLQEDPYELNNSINDPKMRDVLGDLKVELNRLLIETGAEAIKDL